MQPIPDGMHSMINLEQLHQEYIALGVEIGVIIFRQGMLAYAGQKNQN
jgi:hypothetical protein